MTSIKGVYNVSSPRSAVDDDGEIPPHMETYAKTLIESVSVKFIRVYF